MQATAQESIATLIAGLPADGKTLVSQHSADLVRAISYSPWLRQTLLKDPYRFLTWLEQGRLGRKLSPPDLHAEVESAAQNCQTPSALQQALRTIHLREEIIIAWRDLNGHADLQENLNHLSELAEITVTVATSWLTEKLIAIHGPPIGESSAAPVALTLLAMGKLGGSELNFHSDIDLIAVFGEAGNTAGSAPISNHEFFTRLIKQLVDLLQNPVNEGALYNVDLRLRPFGDSGPLVVTTNALEAYYSSHGREWERYALIKARPIGTGIACGEQLLTDLSPFIYRRYLDYGAFQSLRDLKQEIDRQVERKSRHYNLKLGRGGIREIEFITQVFQLVHGGRDPSLQQTSLNQVIPLLAARGDLSDTECQILLDAYRFLRRSEHRIQMLQRRQQQQLPADATDLLRLAAAMGYASSVDYLAALTETTAAVAELFSGLLTPETTARSQPSAAAFADLWRQPLREENTVVLLKNLGYNDPQHAYQSLLALQKSRNHQVASTLAQQRLQRVLPNLLVDCAKQVESVAVLDATLRLLGTILRRSAYISLLYENPTALQRLCQLCSAGPWVTDWLCQHPTLLDELLDNRLFRQRPAHTDLVEQFSRAVTRSGDDLEQQMNQLRDQRNALVLRAAMLDIIPKSDSGNLLTETAELVLDNALRLAWQQLTDRHGPPPSVRAENRCEPGLLIIGYGKLGSDNLSYRSDLDLVLLHPAVDADLLTTGNEPTSLSRFYIRVTQRLIHLLSTQTTSGRLYEVDTRLRPSGNAGPIVSDLASFQRYQLEQAQTWEHQALVHARPIAGDTPLRKAFIDIRRSVLRTNRNHQELVAAIIDMRERISREKTIVDQTDHIKLSDGGMLDIEFFSQYLVLQHAAAHPDLACPTATIEILNAAIYADLLDPGHGAQLIGSYRQLNRCRRQWELGQAIDPSVLDTAELEQNFRLIRQLMN